MTGPGTYHVQYILQSKKVVDSNGELYFGYERWGDLEEAF